MTTRRKPLLQHPHSRRELLVALDVEQLASDKRRRFCTEECGRRGVEMVDDEIRYLTRLGAQRRQKHQRDASNADEHTGSHCSAPDGDQRMGGSLCTCPLQLQPNPS